MPVIPFFDVHHLASYRSAFTENSSRSAAFLEKKQQVLRASENPGVFTMKCRIKFEFAVQEEFYKYTPTDTGMEICQYFGVENWQHMTPDEVTSYYMSHWSVVYVELVSKDKYVAVRESVKTKVEDSPSLKDLLGAMEEE